MSEFSQMNPDERQSALINQGDMLTKGATMEDKLPLEKNGELTDTPNQLVATPDQMTEANYMMRGDLAKKAFDHNQLLEIRRALKEALISFNIGGEIVETERTVTIQAALSIIENAIKNADKGN